MEPIINIKVIDPLWLEKTKSDIEFLKSIKEPEDIDAMKYQEGVAFTYKFEIESYKVNRDCIYELDIVDTKVQIQDVAIIEFTGIESNGKVVMSKDLIFEDFAVKQVGKKMYCYIYLDGRIPYKQLREDIWITEKIFLNLLIDHRNLKFNFEDNIDLISISSRIPVLHNNNA